MDKFHTPVLVNEAINYLQVQKGEKYLDATLGGGGHSQKIHEAGGVLLSLDQDIDAINHVAREFKATVKNSKLGDIFCIGEAWQIVKANFAEIETIGKEVGFTEIAGILFDLGLSSHQLEDEARGFSFNSNEELDMRMDRELGVKASVLVNGLTKKELENIFLEYGEEPLAWKIAREIVKLREKLPIRTCRQLAEICERVRNSGPKQYQNERKIHPATQVFQALRIVINNELDSLSRGLNGGYCLLKPGGRMVCISFHSLEDRIIKNTFRNWEKENKGEIMTREIVTARQKELIENPRSRSAKMRVFKKNIR